MLIISNYYSEFLTNMYNHEDIENQNQDLLFLIIPSDSRIYSHEDIENVLFNPIKTYRLIDLIKFLRLQIYTITEAYKLFPESHYS